MPPSFEVRPIGMVSSSRDERLDDDWGGIEATISLDPECFTPDALLGLDEFSHIEVIFVFDRLDEGHVSLGARHPRGRQDWPKVGIFAQRASSRPNRIGLTTCELLAIDGLDVGVRGLDAIDGTPVIDIKPLVREFQPRSEITQPSWMGELMAGYW